MNASDSKWENEMVATHNFSEYRENPQKKMIRYLNFRFISIVLLSICGIQLLEREGPAASTSVKCQK